MGNEQSSRWLENGGDSDGWLDLSWSPCQSEATCSNQPQYGSTSCVSSWGLDSASTKETGFSFHTATAVLKNLLYPEVRNKIIPSQFFLQIPSDHSVFIPFHSWVTLIFSSEFAFVLLLKSKVFKILIDCFQKQLKMLMMLLNLYRFHPIPYHHCLR